MYVVPNSQTLNYLEENLGRGGALVVSESR